MKIAKFRGFMILSAEKLDIILDYCPCCTFWNITVFRVNTFHVFKGGKKSKRKNNPSLTQDFTYKNVNRESNLCLLMTMLLTQYRFFWDQLDKTQTSKLCPVNIAVVKLQKWVQNCLVWFIYLFEMGKMKTMSLFSATHMI